MDTTNKPIKPEIQNNHHDSSPKKLPISTGGDRMKQVPISIGAGGDRMKRDEWSEGAVSSLLEAYESKWILRNRAKLKGHDWEDVAKYVSARAGSSKSPKTQTQCKNKIESMKKRYRSESANGDVSSWPLYPRLDLLLRGNGGAPMRTAVVCGGDPVMCSVPVTSSVPVSVFDHAPVAVAVAAPAMTATAVPVNVSAPATVTTPVEQGTGQNSIDSNGVEKDDKEEMVVTKMPENQPSEKMEIETDCSTPALYSNDKDTMQTKNHKTRITGKRRRKGENWDIAESIRWFAKVMIRSEQAKVEAMRELEKMRVDAEVKRGELDLKRTEIIAHTQLEIARLFATCLGKAVDPSLRLGPN